MTLLLAILLSLLAFQGAAEPTQVKLCVPYDQPPAYADLCTSTLAAANTDKVEFSCVIGFSVSGCMKMIGDGEAHLSNFDGADIMEANRMLDMVPLIFENYGYGVGTSYYAIAAVREEFCTDTTTFQSLGGQRSCHTGYRKTAGWISPLGALLRSGALETVRSDEDVQDDAETIAGYFSQVCAPRTTADGPKSGADGGELWDGLCSGCGGDCTTHDRYYDYQGAFRCLTEGSGDVAFIKHTTIPDFAAGGEKAEDWATDGPDAFKLLCPDGGCASVDDYASCYTARVPAHALVSPGSFAVGGENEELGRAIQDALVAAVEASEDFLESANQLGGQKNFIFKSGTIGLDPVTSSFEEAMGMNFVADYEAIGELLDSDGDR